MMSAKDFIEKYIDENASVFTDTSDKIWENPELSLKEFSSAALYCELLKKGGFEVTEELGGIKTAFCGKFGKGKPVIGILGEYDALSGLSQKGGATEHIELVPGGAGHGCGHNLLGAGSLGAAFAVKAYLEESGAPGTVIYFGCPGEEGGAGKAYLAREGLWKMLDAAITWHPSDINEIPSGTNNSCIQVLYKFKGLASHACSAYSGRSALDAVELMNVGVQFLREHMTPDCYIHYAITDAGGASPNVVQPTASVLYMVRANRVKDSIKLQKRVDKIAEGAALMTETSYDRTFIDGTADLLPNYTLEEILHESLTEFGVPEYTDEEMEYASALKSTYEIDVVPSFAASVDAEMAKYVKDNTGNLSKTICDFIMPVYHSRAFTPGSTDVGDVSWLTPTAQIHTACFTLGSPGHSWQNVSCGKTSVAHKGMLLAAKALALSAVKLMEDETLLRIAKKEFAERSEDGYTCPIEPDAVPIAI